MSSKENNARRVQVKLALASKYDHLAKVAKSIPRQKTLKNHAAKFRREAADLTRR